MSILFPYFLTQESQYNDSVKLWDGVCQELLQKYHQQGVWLLWGDRGSNNDGYDGNPIYWLVNSEQKKGVRVIQLSPDVQTNWPISAHTNKSGDEFLPSGIVDELVFSCQLTEDAVGKFRILFENWVQPDSTVTKINEMIDDLIK